MFDRLSAARDGSVILVAAPAGSGKTMLINSWLDHAHAGERIAWMAVGRDEHDEQAFWGHVVDSLRAALGGQVIEPLGPTPGFDAPATVDRLISNLASVDVPVLLVIDDLHELKSPGALDRLETFIARRPSQLRIALLTRHDPQLGLHRLRLAGELTEIRAADLSFTGAEAAQLLGTAGVELNPSTLAELVDRTEGWAAGLRLAGLSLRLERDQDRFVKQFSGSDRTVAEYLLAEVLERQPEPVRELLLRTAVVDRINGPLAEALTGMPEAETVLRELDIAHAFVVEADIEGEKGWFRYHHLLGDLLALELRRRHPGEVSVLHRRAADWYELHGDAVRAVRHAQAAEDWPRAEGLIVDHMMSLFLDGRAATVSELLRAFPAARRSSSGLAVAFAAYELTSGSLESADSYLAVAERHRGDVGANRLRLHDTLVAVARLTIARRRGDFSTVAARVKALFDTADYENSEDVTLSNDARVVGLADLGTVELWSFRVQDAERHLAEGLELSRRIDRPYVTIGCLTQLALLAARDSPDTLRERAREALALAEKHGWTADPVVVMVFATMALADVVQVRSDAAREWLARAEFALQPQADPAAAFFVRFVTGLERVSRGAFDLAVDQFRAADRMHAALAGSHALGVAVRELLVHSLLRVGDLDGARETLIKWPNVETEHAADWAERHVAEADVRLAEGDAEAAIASLAAVSAGKTVAISQWTVIAAFILEARAHEMRHEQGAARQALERALDSAEIESRVFPFVWFEIRGLLEQYPRHETGHAGLIADLLDLLEGRSIGRVPGRREELLEPLSESELRVLRFLASNLSASEIAGTLFVSTSTVKTHMRHIYEKFGVHRRSEAVERARELGLLASPVR